MADMAAAASEAEKNGEVNFIPDRFSKIYQNWLNNIHDWCISRQLWWGHRIPAYTCDDCGEITVVRGGMPENARNAAAPISPRTRIPWTPGSVLLCGRSPR